MIKVETVQSPQELKLFVRFPWQLYKGDPCWVPPIFEEELKFFDPEQNPVFEHSIAHFLLAYDEQNQLVGRAVAIINDLDESVLNIKKIRFGWFDFIDDLEVSQALLDKIKAIGQEHHRTYMEGPMGFSNLDKVGVLTSGFDSIGTMASWHNHPYYQKHYEANGLTVEKEYVECRFPFSNIDITKAKKVSKIVRHRFGYAIVNPRRRKEVFAYADDMFRLFNESYAKLSSYLPITDNEIGYIKKKFLGFIAADFIKFVLDKDKNMIAFAIVMPQFAHALIKSKGKLLPFGFLRILWAKKFSKTAVFYLIGVSEAHQNKGATALLFESYHEDFSKRGMTTCIRTPELATNTAIRQLWKDFSPEVYKTRATYSKVI